jgi:glyoxylase-like metal-dependent hydrolase (beta-lactamase superfamily II)
MAAMGVDDGWVEIGDRFFVRRYEFFDQNIGLVLGDREALVIDTRSTHRQGREIIEHVREVTRDPITVVVDTHGHFDHAFGNSVFRPATIWAQAGCVTFLERTGEVRKPRIALEVPELTDELPDVVIDPPDRTFETATTIEVGGRPVDLRFLGRGHTDHDAVITVPGTSVVWAGDLVENGALPATSDAYLVDWVPTAAALAELVDPADGVIVPGHGDHAGRAFADAQAGSFGRLVELAREVHDGSRSLDEAIAAHPFPDYDPAWAAPAFERALKQLRGDLA